MTRRLGRAGGVTAWLRARRAARATAAHHSADVRDAPPIDVDVPAGVIVVLPTAEDRALDWDRRPTEAERNSVTVVPSQQSDVTVVLDVATRTDAPDPGTPRARGAMA